MLKKIITNPFFIFPLFTFVFFWPISLQILTLKNDALTYYYPVRTLISDALNNFELPLWTPFINMGYPLHADMQSGAWNPVIWLFGFATNYSLAAFHYELLLYIAFGGIGFYFLGREYGWNKYTALLIGFSYEFSGPVLDSIQFTACISSMCYIPYIFLFFRRFLYHQRTLENALLTALFLYLLFTGGYPALFIITLYLLIFFLLFGIFFSTHKIEFLKKIILPLGIASVAFTLLALPAIISFVNHLQFIDRGKIQGLDFVLENSMPPACMFSLLSPFSTTANTAVFNTNMLMRNIYIGSVPVVFLIYTIIRKDLSNKKELRFFVLAAFLLFGMAWGSHFFLRQLAYYTLPLMNTFRHPALFRFFGVIFLLLIAGFGIDEWSKKSTGHHILQKIICTIGGIVFCISLLIILFPPDQLIPSLTNFSQLKHLVSMLNFQQRFLIQLPFIIAQLCIFYYIILKRRRVMILLLLSISDLFFATQLNLPITVVGAGKFAETEKYINRNQVRFPLPGNTTIAQNVLNSIDLTNTIGSRLPFEKKTGRNDYFITPGNLSLNDKFYESNIKDLIFNNRIGYFADTILAADNKFSTAGISNHAIAFISPKAKSFTNAASKNDTIAITKFSANTLTYSVEISQPRLLVFLQNIYPGWKVLIDGNETSILTANISFMGVNIPAGKHEIVFNYHPSWIIYAWYISLITLISMGLFLLRPFAVKPILANQ